MQVDGFSLAPGTSETAFSFRNYLVTTDSADGDLSVEPSNPTTTPGQQIAVTATVSGLDEEQQYLGWVEYPGGTGTLVVANPDK